MRIGIGLPTTVPNVSGTALLEWARRADAGPFSTLAVLDRLAYDSVDPFVALASAAAVTERIRLATMIAIGPLRSAAGLAKLAASLDLVAGGRLTLGVGVGARSDDYEAAGVPYRSRGRLLSEQLALLRELHADGSTPRLQILGGGASDGALTRMARYADGYAHGGGPPRAFAADAARARAAWHDLGRPGTPRLWGQSYVALAHPEPGSAYLRDYYSFTGPFADRIAADLLTTSRAVRERIRGYRAEGCDELVLLPTGPDPAEVDLLAEIVG